MTCGNELILFFSRCNGDNLGSEATRHVRHQSVRQGCGEITVTVASRSRWPARGDAPQYQLYNMTKEVPLFDVGGTGTTCWAARVHNMKPSKERNASRGSHGNRTMLIADYISCASKALFQFPLTINSMQRQCSIGIRQL